MSLPQLAETIRQAVDALFTPRYVKHLEHEIAHLRGINGRLQIELEIARNPIASVAPAKREPPKFVPIRTNWEMYRDAEIARQEQESDGTQSSRRVDVDERLTGEEGTGTR